MAPLKNDFRNTGITGINVSWVQDVVPKLKELETAGWNLKVTREVFYESGKSARYNYEVLVKGNDETNTLLFRTNCVATVWMYLNGLIVGRRQAVTDSGQNSTMLEELRNAHATAKVTATQLSEAVAEIEKLKGQLKTASIGWNKSRTSLLELKDEIVTLKKNVCKYLE